jgi:hypothetical protein
MVKINEPFPTIREHLQDPEDTKDIAEGAALIVRR